MDTPTRKRKREIQEVGNDEYSFVFGTCGLSLKRRKKTLKSTLPFPKSTKQLPKLPARFHHHDAQVGLLCEHQLKFRPVCQYVRWKVTLIIKYRSKLTET